MTGYARGIWILALVPVISSGLAAQPIRGFEKSADIFRERIVIALPLPYLDVNFPAPPVSGYYAWKVSFGGDPRATVVFRTDSAIRVTGNRGVVRNGRLRSCPPEASSVLDCTTLIRGSARVGVDALILEITEPSLVAYVRERQPDVLLRELFEPGGRFRIEHQRIRYH